VADRGNIAKMSEASLHVNGSFARCEGNSMDMLPEPQMPDLKARAQSLERHTIVRDVLMLVPTLWRLLLKSGTCVAALAGCGLVFLYCGGHGVLKNQTPPVVKSMSVTELEATTDLPDGQWLELSDGYLFWDGALESITTNRLFGHPNNAETINAVYVPLVSKVTFDNWQAFLAKDGAVGLLPYEKCRVVVKFEFFDLKRKFPNVAAALNNKAPLHDPPESHVAVQGVVRRLAAEPKFITERMGGGGMTFGYDPKRTLVLKYDGTNLLLSTEINRIISFCLVAFGLLLGLPLGVWTLRRLPIRHTVKKDVVLLNDKSAQSGSGQGNTVNNGAEPFTAAHRPPE
jgi:hypothetical protein